MEPDIVTDEATARSDVTDTALPTASVAPRMAAIQPEDVLAAAAGDRDALLRVPRLFLPLIQGGDPERRHALAVARRLSGATIADRARGTLAHMLRVGAVALMREQSREQSFDEAIIVLGCALAVAPADRDVRLMRARLHHQLGRIPEIWPDLEALLRSDALDLPVVNLLALLPDSREREGLAAQAGERIRARVTHDPSLGPAAVSALLRLLDFEGASDILAARRPLPGQPADWIAAACELAVASHDAVLTRECLQATERMAPDDVKVRELALELALMSGDRPALEAAHDRAMAHSDVATIDRQTLFQASAARCRFGPALDLIWSTPRYRELVKLIPNLHPYGAPLHPLDGRRVLVIGYTEIGDEIRLTELLDRARSRFAACTVVVDARLAPLLARDRPDLTVVGVDRADAARDPGLPPILRSQIPPVIWATLADYDAVLLMRQFEDGLIAAPSDLPRRHRVLLPDPALRERMRQACACLGTRRKVGLYWKSSRSNHRRVSRVTALDAWAPILQLSAFTFVNLQCGEDVERELSQVPLRGFEPIQRVAGLDVRNDFEGLAALMCELDMVVAVPGTTQHLAGALGVPTLAVTHPSQRLWRARPDSDSGVWSPAVTIVAGPHEEGFGGSIARAADRLRLWDRSTSGEAVGTRRTEA